MLHQQVYDRMTKKSNSCGRGLSDRSNGDCQLGPVGRLKSSGQKEAASAMTRALWVRLRNPFLGSQFWFPSRSLACDWKSPKKKDIEGS